MIDLDVLDNLARDHLQFEVNCTKALRNDTGPDYSSDHGVVCALYRIRSLVMEGNVDDAVPLCEALCSQTIDDPHLQLSIRIHKFCEMIYSTESVRAQDEALYVKSTENALRYAQQLASFALNAFPEAYDIFADAMMLLAYPERTASPEAIHARRESIANQLVSLTRFTVGARESSLSFLLRYLALIYVHFKSSVAPANFEEHCHIDSLVSKILHSSSEKGTNVHCFLWKTEEFRPHRSGSFDAYKEADIQALRERVNITRQESMESLAFTDGNLVCALKNELGRVVVNREYLRKLVVEYCAARGLQLFNINGDSALEPLSPEFLHLSMDQSKPIIPRKSINDAMYSMFHDMKKVREFATDRHSDHNLESIYKIQSVLEKAAVDASILKFRLAQRKIMLHLHRREFDVAIQASKETLGPIAAVHPEVRPCLADTMTLLMFAQEANSIPRGTSRKQRGAVPEIEVSGSSTLPSEMNRRDEGPTAVFRKDTTFRPPQQTEQELLSFEGAIVECRDRVFENCSLESIVREAFSSLQKSRGEPDMLRVLQGLLNVHQKWQTENMMSDELANAFGVQEILGASNSSSSHNAHDSPRQNEARLSDQTMNSGSSADQETYRTQQREQTILVLMEFMNMSRAEAIAVLRNYPQSASTQSILDSLLGSLM
ncbi:hypothetical protein BWQ96_00466 [Gracilariopsis chorda]|uniref:CTLH domain-containing protein n=1 Tax=Gracilariopsis chorda TaxID=448386 RepID=A0A2V3J614_9FLOR|nr:hypothetical protein BWQ96_00466 [Gracilariopsis chorda]|eukprot:PXF49814.1 hypothetical protein BWQ96_00466 [Gracilariopsis chorda]